MFNIPTYLIEQVTLAAATDSHTLTYVAPSVPWTPRHLIARYQVQNDTGSQTFKIQLNSDTGNNYNQQQVQGISSTASANRNSDRGDFFLVASTNTSNIWSSGEIMFPDAFSTRSHKSMLHFGGESELQVQAMAGRWADTSAITSVTFLFTTDNIAVGSILSLWVVDESFNHSEQII